jgi:transcriptional regulator with XRE-family HTH domain
MSPYEFLLRELRLARTAANLTQDAVGERIHFSAQKVSAIETGRAPLTPDLVKLIDDAVEAGGRLVRMWDDLVKDGAAPTWLREWLEVEREALTLRWYEPAYVPGLLQTEAYARATLAGSLAPAAVDQRVTSRLQRQDILAREEPPQLFVVLDEMVIRRACGGRAIMAEQLAHLTECAERPRIHLHIVPASLGMYPGLAGAFILAELPGAVRFGHADNQLDAQIVGRAEGIASLGLTWETVRGLALPRWQSLDLLKEVAETWT